MIRSLVQHVRGWSFFVKFVVIATIFFIIVDTVTGRGFKTVFENVLFGVTMVAGGQYLAPAVIGTLFCSLHKHKAMTPPCGQPQSATANDWHHVIVSLVSAYSFVTVALVVMSEKFSIMTALWSAVKYMAPWLGLLLLVEVIMETVHFLGHYREHRREIRAQEQAREQARLDRENNATDQAFWDMVRNHKPDPGGVA